MERFPPDPESEALATATIDAAFHLCMDLGPGLLESVYERLLEIALRQRGLSTSRQHRVDFSYLGEPFPGGFRVDLLVEDRLVVEVKAVEHLTPLASRGNPPVFNGRQEWS